MRENIKKPDCGGRVIRIINDMNINLGLMLLTVKNETEKYFEFENETTFKSTMVLDENEPATLYCFKMGAFY